MENLVTISRGLYTLLVKEAHDALCTLYFGSEPNSEGEPE